MPYQKHYYSNVVMCFMLKEMNVCGTVNKIAVL